MEGGCKGRVKNLLGNGPLGASGLENAEAIELGWQLEGEKSADK